MEQLNHANLSDRMERRISTLPTRSRSLGKNPRRSTP